MGRGSSKASGKGTFGTFGAFERAYDRANSKEQAKMFDEMQKGAGPIREYTHSLERNMKQSIAADGYDDFTDTILKGELKDTRKELNALPKAKTAKQWGEHTALNERIDTINNLRKNKGTKATKNSGISDIATYRVRGR